MSYYIYLGKYFHRHGGDIGDLKYERKIGFTDNLDRRERELNSTKMTIGYTIALAWDLGTEKEMRRIEGMLHAIEDDHRLSGEWFLDLKETLEERVSKFMRIGGYSLVDLGEDDDEDVNNTRRLARNKSKDSLVKEWFKDPTKWSQYFANKKFKLIRPNGFEQIITIQPNNEIHCDTENTVITINDKNYTPNYAFESGMRKKWIKDGINPEGKLNWYGDEWKRISKEQNLWKSFNNGWDTVDLESGKTLMELATEIYEKHQVDGTGKDVNLSYEEKKK